MIGSIRRWFLRSLPTPRGMSLLALLLLGVPFDARAQSALPTVEVAVLVSTLSEVVTEQGSDWGIGGRLSYWVSPWVALEGEGTVATLPPKRSRHGGHRSGRGGVTVGWRGPHGGVLGKVQLGVLQYHQPFVTHTHVIGAVGGVLELYPSRHILVRDDIEDLMIRRRDGRQRAAGLTHNLQVAVSVGVRL